MTTPAVAPEGRGAGASRPSGRPGPAVHGIETDLDQQQAVQAVTAALADQGFGVLTTIDVRATLAEKLGEQVDDYVILGACNPRLAHAALSVDPEVGLLLPCNVTVRQVGGKTLVQAVDPEALLVGAGGGGPSALAATAADAAARLRAALDTLSRQERPT